jgi:hypothetical protein
MVGALSVMVPILFLSQNYNCYFHYACFSSIFLDISCLHRLTLLSAQWPQIFQILDSHRSPKRVPVKAHSISVSRTSYTRWHSSSTPPMKLYHGGLNASSRVLIALNHLNMSRKNQGSFNAVSTTRSINHGSCSLAPLGG